MEEYFLKYRIGIIGDNVTIDTSPGTSLPLIYADWTASGRLYKPIEDRITKHIYPFVANTHTDTNYTGSLMTNAYHLAQQKIKTHVGANTNDILITCSSGMTGVVNKLQRILGLKLHESFKDRITIAQEERPIVLITHMEHHSNQTSWLETIAEVKIVPPDENGLVSIENFRKALFQYASRKTKIAAITSCSNVTGIFTPYFDIAEIMHEHNGFCFVDFACSAPYVEIDMHPNDSPNRYLDAIYFSPHKFLGGPGSCGVLVFNKNLYHNSIPDNPGGGTVKWTNPWGEHKYVENIEAREDGGTPAFIQTIRAAFAAQLKEEMGVENMLMREKEILNLIWDSFDKIPNLHILANDHRERLGIVSFYIDNLHFNLGVKLLNDRFGIQTRGGCSCAGTYGHYLLNVSPEYSHAITDQINEGDCSSKPGWIRLSVHPTHTNKEIIFILDAIKEMANNHTEWAKEYDIDWKNGILKHKLTTSQSIEESIAAKLFEEPFI